MAFFSPKLSVEVKHGNTAIAIDADRNGQLAVKWAVENLLNHNNRCCTLVHVKTKTSESENLVLVLKDGTPQTQEESLNHLFLPYRGFCARKDVELKEVVIHDTDIVRALVGYLGDNCIDNIVLGASSRNAFTRKFAKNLDVPSSLLKFAPESCSVYVISKGKIQASRNRPQTSTSAAASPGKAQTPSSAATSPRPPETPSSAASSPRQPQSPIDSANSNTQPQKPGGAATSPWQPQTPTAVAIPRQPQIRLCTISSLKQPIGNAVTHKKLQNHRSFVPQLLNDSSNHEGMPRDSVLMIQRHESRFSSKALVTSMDHQSLGMILRSESRFSPKALVTSIDHQSLDVLNRDTASGLNDISGPPSSMSLDISSESLGFPQSPDPVEEEIWRLKRELKQTMEMYNSVCKEAVMAKQMAKKLQHLHSMDARKLDEAKVAEEAALSLAEMEKQKAKAAIEAAQMAQRLAEMEAQKRENAETRAMKAESALAQQSLLYRKYTIQEIEVATDYFESSKKIGEGGYGPVFKAILDHTAVAIKVLRPDLSQGQRQFQKEVEVLVKMRHPHMVILLGACPEYGCLVYEYMERGSLEDRLFRKGNTPSISWRKRFTIASEIASGILFLHETKPEPLVHRDLKPANILLDRHYVSKIADVGLARLIPGTKTDSVSQDYQTAAAGTFCYIDPEYQQTGMLGVKSDLYSLGVILLQLLTAKNPMGLSHQVEQAIEEGNFSDILDPTQTDWPIEEGLSLAKLALKCCELRKKDRPDLAKVVLPELNRLREFALANEDDEALIISPLPCSCSAVPEEQCHTNQINTQGRRQHHFKFLPKLRSFKANRAPSRKASIVAPRRGNRGASKKSDMVKFQGCWSSFARCASTPNAPIQRLKSFS